MPLSRPGNSRQPSTLLKQAVGFAAALIFPWVTTALSTQLPALRGTPLAFSFACVAVITILTGLGPGLAGSVVAALAFNHYLLATTGFFSASAAPLLHMAVAFAVSIVIVLLCERQRITSSTLRATLATLQARTDALVEAQQGSNSAAWMYDIEQQRVHWAEGGSEIFGRPFSELTTPNATSSPILEEERGQVVSAVNEATRTGKPFQLEFRVRWPGGDVHWLESRGTPSPANPGIWHGVTIDITDRKNAEAALVRSEKLAAIGRLSATIAHEVNNPLEAVTNLLYLALTDPHLSPQAREYLQFADKQLAHLATIARRTLSFVRPRASAGPVDPGEIVESVAAMFQPRCSGRNAEIRILHHFDCALTIPADDLRQILTNLVSNACDALPESGGLIEIEIACREQSASICIRDNGSGIAPENLHRVFDPFFTTKEDVGTGIGLWITRDLVEKNGGRISLHTTDLPAGFRTMFCVDFPTH